MRRHRLILLGAAFSAAVVAGIGGASAVTRDYGAITCGVFLASGQSNMAFILWWLRGYHAGKRGVPLFDPADAYAARLGYFCRNHPKANLIESSERILSELDRGI